jgi:hypothetical protein
MKLKLLLIAAFAGVTTSANAINAPVPTNAYLVENGLDWAWAYPLPADCGQNFSPCPGFDLSYQSQFGWRLPTAQELANPPLATNFLFAGGMYRSVVQTQLAERFSTLRTQPTVPRLPPVHVRHLTFQLVVFSFPTVIGRMASVSL